jgi:hypothetical protein
MSTPWIKLLSFTLLTLTTLSCLGCRSTANQDNKIHILTTTSIIADIVNRVGGDFVEVTSLIPMIFHRNLKMRLPLQMQILSLLTVQGLRII